MHVIIAIMLDISNHSKSDIFYVLVWISRKVSSLTLDLALFERYNSVSDPTKGNGCCLWVWLQCLLMKNWTPFRGHVHNYCFILKPFGYGLEHGLEGSGLLWFSEARIEDWRDTKQAVFSSFLQGTLPFCAFQYLLEQLHDLNVVNKTRFGCGFQGRQRFSLM